MASPATSDLCDSNAKLLATGGMRVLQPIFQVYGNSRAFSGQIVTVKVFEDNVLVREILATKGEGRVLVIDGAGSRKRALMGGKIGKMAQNNRWSGVVINGCIRDVDEINECSIGVRALGSNPTKPTKKGHGEKHGDIEIGGTLVQEGEWLYADSDGVIISQHELSV